MKSTQRRRLSLVPWAKAGVCRAAMMPSMPAAAVKPAAAEVARNFRRVTMVGPVATFVAVGVVIDTLLRACWLAAGYGSSGLLGSRCGNVASANDRAIARAATPHKRRRDGDRKRAVARG